MILPTLNSDEPVNSGARKRTTYSAKAREHRLQSRCLSRILPRNRPARFTGAISATTSAKERSWQLFADSGASMVSVLRSSGFEFRLKNTMIGFGNATPHLRPFARYIPPTSSACSSRDLGGWKPAGTRGATISVQPASLNRWLDQYPFIMKASRMVSRS